MAPEISGEETVVSKLTLSTLGCQPSAVKLLKPEEGTKLAIARLFGKISGVRYQEDKTKGVIHTYFVGTFEGINLQDGTVLRSGKMFLPKGISEMTEEAVLKAKEKDEKSSITFAFEVRAVKATNPIGYSYEAAALKNPEAEDELKEMRQLIAKLPTLEQRKLQAAAPGDKSKPVVEGQARKSA